MKRKTVGALVAGCAVLTCAGLLPLLLLIFVSSPRVRVARITNADPRLQKAAEVAQATLPKFLDRLSHPLPGDRFAVKVQFKTSVGPEYLWLKEPATKGQSFTGILDQRPIALEAHKGDRLSFERSQIYDYLIERADGSRVGGFTEIALSGGPS